MTHKASGNDSSFTLILKQILLLTKLMSLGKLTQSHNADLKQFLQGSTSRKARNMAEYNLFIIQQDKKLEQHMINVQRQVRAEEQKQMIQDMIKSRKGSNILNPLQNQRIGQRQTQSEVKKEQQMAVQNDPDYFKDLDLMRKTIYRDANGKLDLDKFKLAYHSKRQSQDKSFPHEHRDSILNTTLNKMFQQEKIKQSKIQPQHVKHKGTGHIFRVVDRFRRDKLLSPREQSPPVGNYTPKYEMTEETRYALKFKHENSPRSTFLGVREDAMFTNGEIKCTKFPRQLKTLTDKFNETMESFHASQSSPTNSKELFHSFDSTMRQSKFHQTVTLQSPLFQLQNQVEKVYGKKVRDQTPLILEKDLESHFDTVTQSSLPHQGTVTFSKQRDKESIIYKMTPQPIDARFDLIDKFPRILSKNKKLSVDLKIKNMSPRKDIIKEFGVTDSQIANPSVFYNKKYSQVEKKTPFVVFSRSAIQTAMDFKEDIQSNHPSFKPKVRLNKASHMPNTANLKVIDF